MSASRRLYEQRMIQRRDQEQAHENLRKKLGSDVWAAMKVSAHRWHKSLFTLARC